MRMWIRYLREKRNSWILYLVTVFFFVTVGSLYHIENLKKLLYAALLTFAVWSAAGFLEGIKYVKRSIWLEKAFSYFEQTGELLLQEREGERPYLSEKTIEYAESYTQALEWFLLLMAEWQSRARSRWEEKSAECNDYYLMWTHQVKTPIAALKLLVEKGSSQGREQFLMQEELFKIEQYVEMVLTFQRLGDISSDLVLQEYDLGILIRHAVKKYSVLFINKGLALNLHQTDQRVITDEKWFVFCLEQLLSNAIKYTSKGGISVWTESTDTGDLVKLVIEDTGIGIRAEDLPRIFEKGFTGYNGRLDKRSTGIGLYLSRRILNHLGISIKVESEEGQGTKIMLGLPCPKKDENLTKP